MTYQRDLKKLIASLDSLTNGQAAVQVDEENICKFTLTIIPNDGPYRNGKFDFEISVDDPDSYPVELPEVKCATLIYHPNIDFNVCLSLFHEWDDSNDLADIVQGLLFLFYNPNIEDPLNSLFNASEMELILKDKFTERVRMSLMGGLEVNGVTFTRNQVTDDNSPGSCEAVKNGAPCSTESIQEINDTPDINANDTNTNDTPNTNANDALAGSTFQRDLEKLIASLSSLTNGQAAVQVDKENIYKFTLTIIPNDGPYQNGKFDFEISVDDPDSGYPAQLPEVKCTTLIYHPNIDIKLDGTNVCLSLFDEWEDSNDLVDIVQGLLFLFYNPNIEDPLSSLFDVSEIQTILQDKFTERVRMSLMGRLEVDGVMFTRNQVTDDVDAPYSTESIQETNDISDTNTNDTPDTNTNDIPDTNTNDTPDTNDNDVLAASTENPSYNGIGLFFYYKNSEVANQVR